MLGLRQGLPTKIKASLIIIFILILTITATVKKIREVPEVVQIQGGGQENQTSSLGVSDEEKPEVIESITQTSIQMLTSTPKPLVENKVKVGIVVDDYANKFGTITALENQLGTTFSTVSVYKQFGLSSNDRLNQEDLSYIKRSGKTLMITWEPWNPLEGMNQSKDYLNEIIAGNMDSYIKNFAQDIKTYNYPVVLRFAHEMNGDWYPWGQRPEDYKKAYIKIVDIFRNQGVANVKYNWSVNSDNVPYEPFSSVSRYYPGDSYVDSISIDGYNWGTSGYGTGWRSFYQIFSVPYNYLTSNYNKPLLIAEMASSEEGGNKADWITQTFSVLSTNFPKIREIIWFNLLKESDWRIESTPSSLNAFKKIL